LYHTRTCMEKAQSFPPVFCFERYFVLPGLKINPQEDSTPILFKSLYYRNLGVLFLDSLHLQDPWTSLKWGRRRKTKRGANINLPHIIWVDAHRCHNASNSTPPHYSFGLPDCVVINYKKLDHGCFYYVLSLCVTTSVNGYVQSICAEGDIQNPMPHAK
jgi:hypothetical protein